jgi:hypothetical protein
MLGNKKHAKIKKIKYVDEDKRRISSVVEVEAGRSKAMLLD